MGHNLTRPAAAGPEILRVDPQTASWDRLAYSVFELKAGEEMHLDQPERELALVTISGGGVARVAGQSFELARRGVFEELSPLLYVPPGSPLDLAARSGGWTLAVGSAPAEGRFPPRLIDAAEVAVEIRGGGAALRQVSHVLAPPLPAERLIVYEVVVPAGSWAGWPPHRHDGEDGSPYLEETYYFRFDRPGGFGFHRNYDEGGTLDEAFTVGDGDCVSVPRGFHVTAAAPGHNMWILNFLAGDLIGEDRATPPYFDPATTWITDDWTGARLKLPAAVPVSDGLEVGR